MGAVRQMCKSLFPLALHAHISKRTAAAGEKFLRRVGAFRSAGPDLYAAAGDRADIAHQLQNAVNVPDVRGESRDIRLSLHDIRKDIPVAVIDGIFRDFNLHVGIFVSVRVGLETVDGRTGVYVLGVHGDEKYFHGIFSFAKSDVLTIALNRGCRKETYRDKLWLFGRTCG